MEYRRHYLPDGIFLPDSEESQMAIITLNSRGYPVKNIYTALAGNHDKLSAVISLSDRKEGFLGFSDGDTYFCNNKRAFLTGQQIRNVIGTGIALLPDMKVRTGPALQILFPGVYREMQDPVRNVIADLHPDFIMAYDKVLESRYCYMDRIFLFRKRLLLQYVSWMVSILGETQSAGYDFSADKRDVLGIILFNTFLKGLAMMEDIFPDEVRMQKIGFLNKMKTEEIAQTRVGNWFQSAGQKMVQVMANINL